MKSAKKIIALIITFAVMLSCVAFPASAESKVDPSQGTMQKIESVFYMMLDKLVITMGKAFNRFIPGLDWGNTWQDLEDYKTPESFFGGEEKFDTAVSDSSVWSAGYAYGSLLDGLDVLNGEYNMAGSLEALKGKAPDEILDDQGVNVYALSDGVSGIVVQAVIDGFGIARGDVLKIRERLLEFAKENSIVSFNVSVLHQHSAIDTLGMGVALVPALIANPGVNVMGLGSDKLVSGKNEKFMENLYKVVTDCVVKATESMTAGTLYYGASDVSDLMHDKRKPDVFDGEIHRLRFVPYDETKNEIWICEAGIHCTGFSSDNTALSADFPYYFKEYVKNTTGADVVYVQGAEVAITTDRSNVKYTNTAANSKVKAYGEALAKRVMAIESEQSLEPVLNVKHQEVALTADNPVLTLAVREGIIASVATKNGLDFTIVTEIGYMELGNEIGIAIVPGEIAPEILWGGAVSADESWTHKTWDYASLESTANISKLICFGLNNDQIGYILPDNDIRSMFTENEEINVAATNAGSVITQSFQNLITSVK